MVLFIYGSISIAEAQEPIIIYPTSLANGIGFGKDIMAFGNVTAIWSRAPDSNDIYRDAVYVFRKNGENWIEEGRLMDTTILVSQCFGTRMAGYGEYILIGDSCDDEFGENAGSVFVFKYENGSWIRKVKLSPSDSMPQQGCGSVALYENYAIVGCATENIDGEESAGSAYIYKREGEDWIEQTKLIPPDPSWAAKFGLNVSINEDYAFVGAPDSENTEGDRIGAAYVYKREGEDWTLQTRLTASDAMDNDGFARVIGTSDTLVVGTTKGIGQNTYYKGAAYIFVRQGEEWQEIEKLIPQDDIDDDLSLKGWDWKGDYLVLANSDNIDNATIHLYKKNGGNWEEQMTITKEPEGIFHERFAHDLAIANNHLIVGAWQDFYQDSDSIKSGAVYIYDLDLLLSNEEASSSVESLSIRPNPTSGLMNVSINLDTPISIKRLEIYDIKGRLVDTLIGDNISKLNHQWSLDISNFTNGFYLLKGITENKVFIGRLLKM